MKTNLATYRTQKAADSLAADGVFIMCTVFATPLLRICVRSMNKNYA